MSPWPPYSDSEKEHVDSENESDTNSFGNVSDTNSNDSLPDPSIISYKKVPSAKSSARPKSPKSVMKPNSSTPAPEHHGAYANNSPQDYLDNDSGFISPFGSANVTLSGTYKNHLKFEDDG